MHILLEVVPIETSDVIAQVKTPCVPSVGETIGGLGVEWVVVDRHWQIMEGNVNEFGCICYVKRKDGGR